jgi:hypothetical protein
MLQRNVPSCEDDIEVKKRKSEQTDEMKEMRKKLIAHPLRKRFSQVSFLFEAPKEKIKGLVLK